MYNPDWFRYCKRVVRASLGVDHLLKPEMKLATSRVGSVYGGWTIALEPFRENPNPVVLSFGLGDDISFDEEISAKFGARVYGFDPTPASLKWIAARGKPSSMMVFPIGIANFDGQQTFSLPFDDGRGNFSAKANAGTHIVGTVRRYQSILQMLQIPKVDVLKLDIEGSEYDVIPDIVTASILPDQLLIEFHHRIHEISIVDTMSAVSLIRQTGYSLFAVSPAGQELSFLKRTLGHPDGLALI